MNKPMTTQEKLLLNARAQFWSRGYSNVSVRQIAAAAGVDVALISRHFGGKQGLFEATLAGAFEFESLTGVDETTLIDALVQLFTNPPGTDDSPSALRMLLINAHDEPVGELVRHRFQTTLFTQIVAIVGQQERAAMLVAVLFGISVAKKSLNLPGIGAPDSQKYESQLRYMMHTALDFPVDGPGA